MFSVPRAAGAHVQRSRHKDVVKKDRHRERNARTLLPDYQRQVRCSIYWEAAATPPLRGACGPSTTSVAVIAIRFRLHGETADVTRRSLVPEQIVHIITRQNRIYMHCMQAASLWPSRVIIEPSHGSCLLCVWINPAEDHQRR